MSEHVFDRRPNEPDPHDWKMSDALSRPLRLGSIARTYDRTGMPFQEVVDALAVMVGRKWIAKATKDWAVAVTKYLGELPNPPSPQPAPSPSVGGQVWKDTHQLDQGQTGHCVGFGWAQWGNTEPVADVYTDLDAHAIYYECKIIDGEPQAENGSQVRSGAKAMKARQRLSAYVFAATVDEIKQWVNTRGPVVIGSDWYSNMMNTDRAGFVWPTGTVEGGHCYVLDGDVPSMGGFRFQNSWGSGWGQGGYFFMKYAEFGQLFGAQGDACAALELP